MTDQGRPSGLVRPAQVFPVPDAPVVLPALWGPTTSAVLYLMEWVHRHVRKIAPDETWLRTRYLKRTLLELLAEGTTFCLGPCPERTLVASAALSLSDIPHELVLHERQVPGTGPPIVHMAIELDTEQGPHWFDFGMWESKFFPGAYTFRKDIERTIGVQRVRLPHARHLLDATFDDLSSMLPRRESERDAKVDWYVPDLDHIDPRMLEEYLIFTEAASRYERRRIAPRPVTEPPVPQPAHRP
jgi:hypothetical protein